MCPASVLSSSRMMSRGGDYARGRLRAALILESTSLLASVGEGESSREASELDVGVQFTDLRSGCR